MSDAGADAIANALILNRQLQALNIGDNDDATRRLLILIVSLDEYR
jgi:hypothetical protein